MGIILRKYDLREVSNRIYCLEVFSDRNQVTLYFPDFIIVVKNYLVYKFGYPNDEVSGFMDLRKLLNLDIFVVYTLKDTNWVKEINTLNSNHPKHFKEMFESFLHFVLFLEDDTFECIAQDYEIKLSVP